TDLSFDVLEGRWVELLRIRNLQRHRQALDGVEGTIDRGKAASSQAAVDAVLADLLSDLWKSLGPGLHGGQSITNPGWVDPGALRSANRYDTSMSHGRGGKPRDTSAYPRAALRLCGPRLGPFSAMGLAGRAPLSPRRDIETGCGIAPVLPCFAPIAADG